MPDAQPTETQAEAAIPETQAVAETPVPAAAEAPLKQDDKQKEEKARAVLRGEITEEAKPDTEDIENQFDPETGELLEEDPPVEEQAKAAVEPEVIPAKTEEDEEDEEEKGEDDKPKGKSTRVKTATWTDRDKAILAVAKDKRISFSEAQQILFPDSKPEPVVEQAKAADPTADIEAQIAKVKADRVAAEAAMDFAGLSKLNDQLLDLRDQLKDARNAVVAAEQGKISQVQTAFQTAQNEASAKIEGLFPDVIVEGSDLNKEVNARAKRYEAENPKFFENPKWPIHLTMEVAAELGIAPKSSKPAAAPAKVVPAVPKKVTRPASPSPAPGTATGATGNPTEVIGAKIKAAKASGNIEAIRAALREASAAGV